MLVFHIAVCVASVWFSIELFISFYLHFTDGTNEQTKTKQKSMKRTAQMKIIVMKTHWFGSAAAVAATAAAVSGPELRRTLIFVYFPSMFIPILSILRRFPWDRAIYVPMVRCKPNIFLDAIEKYCAVAIDICPRRFIHDATKRNGLSETENRTVEEISESETFAAAIIPKQTEFHELWFFVFLPQR